ncbi:Pyridoxamine 5'-phosphate oxidase [Paramagnetospirillum magnetotacticum MS-1]|uniref:Pyridoxamine 5'-phosphate oxidase n=1 Tax=Paramagnetospirillum magnetotacticum MS-1 TaxID=272627 RepID=A0A0C2YXQ8_PARME|nr:pyridoxamine 5'-phosphate oxidase family protein [Paramagnetospirillum magnetotacticum]KIL99898.1 Pyridoxamine 5'-phosphate oxidase [Paramagnetospirillum magnetotacticum MS-1]
MLTKTDRTTLRQRPHRGSHDFEAMAAILDEALACTISFVDEGRPVSIPTTHWRMGGQVLFHGGQGSRLAKVMAAGAELCVTVTLVDGLVLARSAFHHSMNYRSVILFGQAVEVTDPVEKAAAFAALIEKLSPGRYSQVRPPTDKELAATKLLALSMTEGSAKMRSGPPVDDEADLSWPVWAGVVPVRMIRGKPVAE